MRADEARNEQRKAQIVREAEDDGDWRDAGCASSVEWFMQLYACDYRSAQRIVRASEALPKRYATCPRSTRRSGLGS